MTRNMTEEKVLKKLGIEDFRHLTKAKVIDLASMLDKMDPEVAKKALEQFPEFAGTVKEILSDYKDSLDKGLESGNESIKSVYDTYSAIIQSLQSELNKDEYSFEERKYFIEQMKDLADKVDQKDSEHKRWIAGMMILAGTVAVAAVTVVATALGANSHIELPDLGDTGNPPV